MAGYIGSKASVVSSGAERKKTFTITGTTTSLTGLNYTVGKVHVFQNGVRLVDGTDYTATNGTTITLTVAAQSGDNVVVISQAAFQVADLPAGTPSIDDNGNATALTIDSSENVQFGTTQTFPAFNNVVGCEVGGFGQISASRDGAEAMQLNRKSSDGNIALLKKDGTTVGSIGVSGSDLFVGRDSCTLKYGNNELLPAYTGNGNVRNDAISLGSASGNFKDLYLSGGVYLGGTGSANKLDDYEEGTFTPSFQSGTFTYSKQLGYYTKIGNLVTISMTIGWSSRSGNGGLTVQNIPFTPLSDSNQYRSGASLGTISGLPKADVYQVTVGLDGGTSSVFLRHLRNNATWGGFDVSAISSTGAVQITATYQTE